MAKQQAPTFKPSEPATSLGHFVWQQRGHVYYWPGAGDWAPEIPRPPAQLTAEEVGRWAADQVDILSREAS